VDWLRRPSEKSKPMGLREDGVGDLQIRTPGQILLNFAAAPREPSAPPCAIEDVALMCRGHKKLGSRRQHSKNLGARIAELAGGAKTLHDPREHDEVEGAQRRIALQIPVGELHMRERTATFLGSIKGDGDDIHAEHRIASACNSFGDPAFPTPNVKRPPEATWHCPIQYFADDL
jgi:hypothetical protein